jgi:hypothetical protein
MLFLASLILAVIIPLLYHFFTGAGLAIYENVLPSAYRMFKARKNSGPAQSCSEDVFIPMGMISRETRAILASTDNKPSKVELQFSGDNSYAGPRKMYSAPSTSRVQALARVRAETGRAPLTREDRLTDVGKVYKVTRRKASR